MVKSEDFQFQFQLVSGVRADHLAFRRELILSLLCTLWKNFPYRFEMDRTGRLLERSSFWPEVRFDSLRRERFSSTTATKRLRAFVTSAVEISHVI